MREQAVPANTRIAGEVNAVDCVQQEGWWRLVFDDDHLSSARDVRNGFVEAVLEIRSSQSLAIRIWFAVRQERGIQNYEPGVGQPFREAVVKKRKGECGMRNCPQPLTVAASRFS